MVGADQALSGEAAVPMAKLSPGVFKQRRDKMTHIRHDFGATPGSTKARAQARAITVAHPASSGAHYFALMFLSSGLLVFMALIVWAAGF